MPAVLAGILEILGLVTTINTFIQTISQLLGHPAQEPTLNAVLLAEQNNNGLIVQLGAADQIILTALANIDARLTAQIGSPQQSNKPVTLPVVPPAGYGGLSSSQTGDAVWLYATGFPSGNALGALAEIRYSLVQRDVANAGMAIAGQEEWWMTGPFYDSRFAPNPTFETFPLDFTTILSTDATADAWLRRVQPALGWRIPDPGFPLLDGVDNFTYFLPRLTQDRFDAIKASRFPTTSLGAPVWPGLANVTLGAALALVDGLLIPGPLDGVVIAITAVPSPISYYPFGPLRSYVHVGGIAFVDDDGEAETVQPIGLNANVVCPKSMAQADHAYIRLQSGVIGTVRPWLHS